MATYKDWNRAASKDMDGMDPRMDMGIPLLQFLVFLANKDMQIQRLEHLLGSKPTRPSPTTANYIL